MDDPTLDVGAHRRALQSLNRVNELFRIHHQLMRAAIALSGRNSFSLLDLGAGGGGLLDFAASSDRMVSGTNTMIMGLDASLNALIAGRGWSNGRIKWMVGDARQIPLSDSSVDIIFSSLFLHHFDKDDVVAILCEAFRVARLGIVMGDLTRSRSALAMTWLGTRILSRSSIFRVDGPRSVRASWTPRELHALALHAGLVQPSISRQFPFRMVLTCKKEATK